MLFCSLFNVDCYSCTPSLLDLSPRVHVDTGQRTAGLMRMHQNVKHNRTAREDVSSKLSNHRTSFTILFLCPLSFKGSLDTMAHTCCDSGCMDSKI